MSLEVLGLSTAQVGRVSAGLPYRFVLCLTMLTAACALASLAFACATPFAAFAVFAGVALPLPIALVVVAVAWIVNQAIGFGVLGYPIDLNTMFWGGAIGTAALIATIVSAAVLRVVTRLSAPIGLGLTLLAAYAAYEIVLFAFTPILGGSGAFTLTIIARLGLLNVTWMVGLLAVFGALSALSSWCEQRLTALSKHPA